LTITAPNGEKVTGGDIGGAGEEIIEGSGGDQLME